MLPSAFRSVSSFWVRKAFQRSDRYLALYAMETKAQPFAIREFMVKCWKRHRDVPTFPTFDHKFFNSEHFIDQVVDKTFDQVDFKKREESNGIKPEK
jgi:hypothetical protein